MSLKEITEKNQLAEKFQHINTSEGKAKSNSQDILRLIVEIKTMPGYPENVSEDEVAELEALEANTIAFIA